MVEGTLICSHPNKKRARAYNARVDTHTILLGFLKKEYSQYVGIKTFPILRQIASTPLIDITRKER